jgi:hypothetical protein
MSAMSDQIIDAVTAQALHADACRDHPIMGWVVMRDQPEPARLSPACSAWMGGIVVMNLPFSPCATRSPLPT